MDRSRWEPVIGLEIHIELNTRSKLFSPAPNRFGDEPNQNISVICTGQPGVLPSLNREAVYKAVRLGCALGAHVMTDSRFDRKSYFYPDSPRNFQITQFEKPIILGGSLVADVGGEPRTFFIKQAHLEDDAGMLKHFSHFAGIDYNRAGVPLIEIVSEPCIYSAEEAIAYAMGIRALAQYLDISDCNMEEGSLRMDVNVSLRPKGSHELRNKIEIKNLNSFAFMGMAIEAECRRQARLYEKNPDTPHQELVTAATYRWDVEKKETVLMRKKERADDYRYFLEPDLPPLFLEEAYIDAVRQGLPELPYEREKRYLTQYGLSLQAVQLLVNEKALADFFERGLTCAPHPKSLCNWIVVEFMGRAKERGKNVWECGLSAEHIGMLVTMIDQGTLTGKMAKEVADLMMDQPGKSPEALVRERPDFLPLVDEAALAGIIDQVVVDHAQSVTDYLQGKERALGFLVGQVMKATHSKASPALIHRLLQEKLSSRS